jgi:hypothetical protein
MDTFTVHHQSTLKKFLSGVWNSCRGKGGLTEGVKHQVYLLRSRTHLLDMGNGLPLRGGIGEVGAVKTLATHPTEVFPSQKF